jgi:hypothetical protein
MRGEACGMGREYWRKFNPAIVDQNLLFINNMASTLKSGTGKAL